MERPSHGDACSWANKSKLMIVTMPVTALGSVPSATKHAKDTCFSIKHHKRPTRHGNQSYPRPRSSLRRGLNSTCLHSTGCQIRQKTYVWAPLITTLFVQLVTGCLRRAFNAAIFRAETWEHPVSGVLTILFLPLLWPSQAWPSTGGVLKNTKSTNIALQHGGQELHTANWRSPRRSTRTKTAARVVTELVRRRESVLSASQEDLSHTPCCMQPTMAGSLK